MTRLTPEEQEKAMKEKFELEESANALLVTAFVLTIILVILLIFGETGDALGALSGLIIEIAALVYFSRYVDAVYSGPILLLSFFIIVLSLGFIIYAWWLLWILIILFLGFGSFYLNRQANINRTY